MRKTGPVIHVSKLTKNYGHVRAVDSISFDVNEGEVVGFLGPNGAGKSTTLRILTGFLPGDSGTVQVAGYDVGRDSIEVRRSIGYLPEGVPLYPELRVLEFLRFRSRLKGLSLRRRKKEIDWALEKAGIGTVRQRIIGTLSKGYRQRVGLADALLGQPPVLILDEPTVGLDPEQLVQFRRLLREVGEERTVFLSTHILSEVDMVCDAAIIIHQGRIAAHDSSENLRRRMQSVSPIRVEISGPESEVVEALESLPEVDRLERQGTAGPETQSSGAPGDGTVSEYRMLRLWPRRDRDPRHAVFCVARDRGWNLRELYREPVTLEEAFLEIVAHPEGSEGDGDEGGVDEPRLA